MASAAPGESLVAFLLGTPTNGDTMEASHHPAALQVQVGVRGYDAGRRIAPYSNLCAVLTDRQVLIASLGGAWGVRPKDVLHAAARGDFRCEWWVNDASEGPGASYLNIVFHFRDGSWAALGVATKLLGRTVAGAALAEEFLSALGSAGGAIDWRATPTA